MNRSNLPPLGAQPGAVGDDLYSAFIRIEGSSAVYNAPIVAVGDGPFDVETHTNTSARTMAISTDPAKMLVELLMIRGFVMGHHQAALDQWNRALAISGKPRVTTPDSTLQPTVEAALNEVTDVPGAARLALMLEDIASATYLAAIPKLKAPESIALAASIQPVDMQHAAILHFVLGEYPVPDVFAKTDQAVAPV